MEIYHSIFAITSTSNSILSGTVDGVQPKMSPFSTRNIIWVKYQVVSQFFQPIFLTFSYLNSERHISVI